MVERSKRKHNQSWQPLLGSKFVFQLFFSPFGAKAFLGLVQGLPFQKALEKGFWCLVKGLKDMNSTNATSSRNRKPAWADMQTPQPEKPLKEKAKDEPMDEEKEEDEWWHRDWKSSQKSWDEWWKDRQNEWDEWKKWEKEQEKEKEQQNEKRKMEEEKAAKREDLQTEDSEVEKEVLQGPPAKWKNRNGSTKERAKGRWAEKRAEEVGEDPQLFRLASLGGSRMRRLVNRQEERASMKETVDKLPNSQAGAGSRPTSRPTSRAGTNRPTSRTGSSNRPTSRTGSSGGLKDCFGIFLMACLFHSRFCVAPLFLSCLSGNAAAHQHQWHAPAAAARPEAARPAAAEARPEAARPAAAEARPARPEAARPAAAEARSAAPKPAVARPEAATAEAYRPEPFLFCQKFI